MCGEIAQLCLLTALFEIRISWGGKGAARSMPIIPVQITMGEHAEFIIGRAFARPVGFCPPSVTVRSKRLSPRGGDPALFIISMAALHHEPR